MEWVDFFVVVAALFFAYLALLFGYAGFRIMGANSSKYRAISRATNPSLIGNLRGHASIEGKTINDGSFSAGVVVSREKRWEAQSKVSDETIDNILGL